MKSNPIKIIFYIFAILISIDGHANHRDLKTAEHELCLYGCPVGEPDTNILIDNDILLLSSNVSTKLADWVAYKVEKKNFNGPSRPRNWKQDPELDKEITFVPEDYKGANAACGYDRGHQAPLGSFTNRDEYYKTNYLSNITPQLANLNQGAWNDLESKVRSLASTRKDNKTIYVATGPYYTNGHSMCKLPNGRTPYQIPSGYWKVIAIEEDHVLHIASFIMPQETARKDDYCYFLHFGLEDITRYTNLAFFKDYHGLIFYDLHKKLGC